ncbi:MAG: hypothetical protein ACI4TB_01850 [Lachnospiraceae bacterium]
MKKQEAGITGKMAEDKAKKGKGTVLIPIVMFIMTILSVSGISFLKGMAAAVMISNTVMSGIGIFAVLLLMAQAKEKGLYDYDNGEHYVRFFIVYLLFLILAISCVYLPAAGWPFLVVFVGLSLFSNTVIGMSAGALLLTITTLLSGSGLEVFVLYFVCGIVGASLFRGLNDAYKIGIPVFVSILFLLTGETAGVVLYADETLKLELFLIPAMNVIISLILLLIILKVFSAVVIYRYRDRYLELNDTECALMKELKVKSKEAYYQAVHTAYFCERIAGKLSLDVDAAKAGGYYHGIGILCKENSWEQIEEKIAEYAFPPAASMVLKEYLDKNTPIRQKETAVLLLSDAIVSSFLFLFSRSKSDSLDYNQIIETVFKKKMETGVLQECKISMDELTRMKRIFKEEKLYYDFLR